MTVDNTEPIVVEERADRLARRVDPWKILACVSTAVSVATIATLVWTVNKVSDDPTPAQRMSAAAGLTTPAIQTPAPPAPLPAADPAPAVPAAQSAPSTPVTRTADPGNRNAPAPAPVAGPWPTQGGLPPVNFASLPAPNIMVNPGFSIDAIIGAVTGTAGWVGGGTLNLLGDAIVASAMNNSANPRPTDPFAALAPLTRIPPPQWQRELDITKIPPPQWPRELDITKIPPPHVHWDRLLPRF